ncbi:MAG: hypothetical protein IH944_08605 [Armatimonadetes bacterium]|nr:hypothetical protein [Armatimonadota bacterium]
MWSRSLSVLVLASVAGLAYAQRAELANSPPQFLIELYVFKDFDGLILPTATIAHDKITIFRGEDKAALLKQRDAGKWGKRIMAPKVRTFMGFPAKISVTTNGIGHTFRTVVFIDEESLLLSFGLYYGETKFMDLKTSDFELHTTYFEEGDIIVVRGSNGTLVTVEASRVSDHDFGGGGGSTP